VKRVPADSINDEGKRMKHKAHALLAALWSFEKIKDVHALRRLYAK
jgi:hypothetical protein